MSVVPLEKIVESEERGPVEVVSLYELVKEHREFSDATKNRALAEELFAKEGRRLFARIPDEDCIHLITHAFSSFGRAGGQHWQYTEVVEKNVAGETERRLSFSGADPWERDFRLNGQTYRWCDATVEQLSELVVVKRREVAAGLLTIKTAQALQKLAVQHKLKPKDTLAKLQAKGVEFPREYIGLED